MRVARVTKTYTHVTLKIKLLNINDLVCGSKFIFFYQFCYFFCLQSDFVHNKTTCRNIY